MLNAVGLLALCCIPLALIGVIVYSRSTITPNDQFFTLQISEIPHLNISSWRLVVDGQVTNPLNLTYNEVLVLHPISLIATLQCVEGIAATAEWKGVKLGDVLDLAQSNSALFDVIFMDSSC